MKSLDKNTIEETDKRDGKVIGVSRMTVAADGKTMTAKFEDKLRRGSNVLPHRPCLRVATVAARHPLVQISLDGHHPTGCLPQRELAYADGLFSEESREKLTGKGICVPADSECIHRRRGIKR